MRRILKQCLVFALILFQSTGILSYAEEGTPAVREAEVEEAFDAVAAAEAESAARAEAEKEEAERIIDVIDLDEEYAGESGDADICNIELEAPAASGSTISLIAGGILIIGGAGVIVASNRKIRNSKG